MKRLTIGILAHVDSGKTSLSEAMLYKTGEIKEPGRVDHGDSFLDTDPKERNRGITIFSKQAILEWDDMYVTLLDTPGHVDFSAEMERCLSVLDYAILVVSGSEGVQSHTETLWKLLKRYQIPTFIFVNKMDLSIWKESELMEILKKRLSGQCVNFGLGAADGKTAASGKSGDGVSGSGEADRQAESGFFDEIAMCSEALMDSFLEKGSVGRDEIAEVVRERQVFPCIFGSALKIQGVERLLQAISEYTLPKIPVREFGAKVFKISRDQAGTRLTFMKITGGTLRVKDRLTGVTRGEDWEEKADQIRIYSGTKFEAVEEAEQGMVCAICGLGKTWAGEGLGAETQGMEGALEPYLTYNVVLPDGVDPHTALQKFRELEEEDPKLNVTWNQEIGEIHFHLMGEIQMEILAATIKERFGFDVAFDHGSIIYKETISDSAYGVGHFEPLRHYAEVHLLLEPGERGSGMCFDTAVSEDELDRNWQRLILTHLGEREHLGVLTGSPITDMKITLVAGRAHKKHTEGGDFRQATYRAVRNGLMKAESVLLEPWFDFLVTAPTENIGRAMADIQKMNGTMGEPVPVDDGSGTAMSELTGSAPVSGLNGYQQVMNGYTKGRGKIMCSIKGYGVCADAASVIEKTGYDPLSDLNNSPDSVFCEGGAGVTVKWDQVEDRMHVESALKRSSVFDDDAAVAARAKAYASTLASDAELMAIFEKTYGPVKDKRNIGSRVIKARPAVSDEPVYKGKSRQYDGVPYLLVDGYNVIHAWDELWDIAKNDYGAARDRLIDIMCNYQGFTQEAVIVVFDAYKVKGNHGSTEKVRGVSVVYTKEAETADMYIEKVTHEIAKKHLVRVVTSDALEQMIILGHGALRISAREFRSEMDKVESAIREYFG